MTKRAAVTILILGLVLSGAVWLRLLVGEPGGALRWPSDAATMQLRAERVCSGAVVGIALAVAGVMLQCLLRNPLASPDIIGLAAGAGLGVMVEAYLAWLAGATVVAGGASIPAALVGALAALGVVYGLSQRRGLIEPVRLILVGVIVSIICGSAMVFVQYLLPNRAFEVSRWMLGSLSDDNTARRIAVVGAATVAATIGAAALGRQMDAATLSEDEARSLGVRLGALRVTLFVLSGVLTAGAVVLAGPIGFVGLVCPHLVRLGAGPSHRTLVIGSALAGAALVVLADALVKAWKLPTGRLPIGVLTSVIGGPLFVWMLRKQSA